MTGERKEKEKLLAAPAPDPLSESSLLKEIQDFMSHHPEKPGTVDELHDWSYRQTITPDGDA
jgi:hypothetical protein